MSYLEENIKRFDDFHIISSIGMFLRDCNFKPPRGHFMVWWCGVKIDREDVKIFNSGKIQKKLDTLRKKQNENR